MKYIPLVSVCWSCFAALSAWADTGLQQDVDPKFLLSGGSRKFSVEYVGRITKIPANTKVLRVWLPVPQDSSVQKITELKFSEPPQLTIEPKYGNGMAFWEVAHPSGEINRTMSFICERREIKMDLGQLAADGRDASGAFAVFRKADKLVLVDAEMKFLSTAITKGKTGAVEKARAIYDHVVDRMTYDKNHAGWGSGSTRHACDVGKGNCTDFHALFNSLCRAQNIASGFEIGLYLPYERHSTEPLGGYHCWAFFRVPGKSWVPVDCSEADRFPARREYFFGNHTPNRVALSTGRDLMLEPNQSGPALNYFLNPYAEADGRPLKAEKTWSYKDLD